MDELENYKLHLKEKITELKDNLVLLKKDILKLEEDIEIANNSQISRLRYIQDKLIKIKKELEGWIKDYEKLLELTTKIKGVCI